LRFDLVMLFDAYVPTRTHDRLEVRVRSADDGPIIIRLGEVEHTLERPGISHGGLHFYRHTFAALQSQTSFELEARQLPRARRMVTKTSTLPCPPGALKRRIGLLADLHLPTETASIDRYRRGTRRLYGLAHELGARYLERLEQLGADAIVLLGDVVDPCSDRTLAALQEMLARVQVPCYPIIGNHEPWSSGGEARFYRALGLPDGGYYAVRQHGVLMLMLSTPSPGALGPRSGQLRWLEAELRATPRTEDVVLFSHFSLLLHPCVQGVNDDGYQLLDNRRQLLELLAEFPNVRVFAAGHKNVPSLLAHQDILHTLSPQLIQAPCGYDVLQLYEGGVTRTTYEVDEQHYCEVARAAYEDRWPERYGAERDRNFSHRYGVA
jgi:3',5'-cyclic AMP phosphodiesterase CpdA